MFNQEILNTVVEKFGTQKAAEFCDIVSILYDIKYSGCKTTECIEEYAFEREWWAEAAESMRQTQLRTS